MDKIKALMVKCDVKPELAERLCEGIESYLAERQAEQDAAHDRRIEEAKHVCLEEVEAHKRELARRFQIFCEARGAAIESSIAKQTAIRESEAQSKLRDILALLEGLEPNGQPNGDLQAEVTKLKRRVQQLSEEKSRAVEQANRANALAGKVLSR